MQKFARIDRLPPYVFAIVDDLASARESALAGRARVEKLLSYEAWRTRFLEATSLA